MGSRELHAKYEARGGRRAKRENEEQIWVIGRSEIMAEGMRDEREHQILAEALGRHYRTHFLSVLSTKGKFYPESFFLMLHWVKFKG